MKYLILTLLLAGCGQQMDSTFAPYVKNFKFYAIQEGRPDKATFDIDIQFVAKSSGDIDAVAACIYGVNNHIEVLKSFWDSSTQARREQIIFHELGHCILSRSHTSNKDSGEEPLSIMYPTIFDDYHYTLNHSYYIHELFLD